MKLKLLLLICLITTATASFAQTRRNEAGIQTDNDSYLLQGSDRYYTDGIYFYFRHALKVKDSTQTALANKVLGFEVGQKIFNPHSGSIPSVYFVDRPFAGYLYLGSNLNLLYRNESNIKLSAQLGVVGPASKAEQIQKFVHNAFGFYPPEGWEYQIQDNVQLNLSAEYNKLFFRTSSIDLSLASYANLGNGFSGAGVGPLFRWGNFNQLFNSVSTQSSAIAQNRIAPLHEHEAFFYYKPQFNYVAYDATIQGGLGKDHNVPGSLEVTLNPERIVFSNQFGLMFTSNRLVFDIAATLHSREVKEMRESHAWGSLTVLYRFN
jgi:lipid A 3-O-deacylase